MWEEISMVNLSSHNVNPGAPEHLAMVNHLLGDNSLKKSMLKGSNLEKNLATAVEESSQAHPGSLVSDDTLLLPMWHAQTPEEGRH